MIRDLRHEYKHTLLLDCGDFFWKRKMGELRAKTTAKALHLMKYDALNLADGELSFGIDFLNQFPKLKPIYLASTLTHHGKEKPYNPYIIKKINGLSVAILGAVSPELVNADQLKNDSIVSESIESKIMSMVQEIKSKTDLIILLSHSGWNNTISWIKPHHNIDLAIVAHDYYPTFDPLKMGNTLFLKNVVGGKRLGIVKLWIDENKKIARYETMLKELSSDIKTYPEYTSPESEFEKDRKILIQKKRDKEEQAKVLKKFEGLLQLSPEEFAKKLEEEGGLLGPNHHRNIDNQ